jgi:hypothetical protein
MLLYGGRRHRAAEELDVSGDMHRLDRSQASEFRLYAEQFTTKPRSLKSRKYTDARLLISSCMFPIRNKRERPLALSWQMVKSGYIYVGPFDTGREGQLRATLYGHSAGTPQVDLHLTLTLGPECPSLNQKDFYLC